MATFRRLLGFLAPYRMGVIVSGLLAAAAMGFTVLIPWLTGRAIDQVRQGDESGLRDLALVVAAAGVLRLALTISRRLVAGRVSLGVELDLRQRMYRHLQSLELAFFDRQQTGQLMSRATVDLQSVRFFLGYGLVFMLQSALTILLSAAAMIATRPGLAAISLAPVPFVVFVAARYGRLARPALQEVQQRIAELTAHVELRDVTLEYEGAGRPALRDVSLDVPAGTTVALVGATGSGKTTLVQLLPRLYDVSEGAVLVDGADVRDVDVASLRSQIAVVNDDPFLFSATVAENIAYARADATREEIELAAQRAQAHDFIARLPDGYDTRVGERGLTLSGGQRQRVAIARALLAHPRILILDDATSSVDASTEQEIKQALRDVMTGRTTFVIAHRLSTISLADTIVVLEDGEVA